MISHPARRGRAGRGLITVEMALLLPILITLLFAIIEFGGIFFAKQNMSHAARQAARGLALGHLTGAEAETLVQTLLSDFGMTFTVVATVPGEGETDVSVFVSVPIAEASFGDAMGFFDGGATVDVTVTMFKEDGS